MAVTGAFAEGNDETAQRPPGTKQETDRIACMAKELKKMNVEVEELADGLIVRHSKPKPANCTAGRTIESSWLFRWRIGAGRAVCD